MINLSPWAVGFDHFTDWRINKCFHTMPDYRDTRKEEAYTRGLRCAKYQLRNFSPHRNAAVFLTDELAHGLGIVATPTGTLKVGFYGLPCKVYTAGGKHTLHTYTLSGGETHIKARYHISARHKAMYDAFEAHASAVNEG